MELEETVPLDCCRLVKYDEFHEYLERSYEGEEDTPMGLLLGGVKSSYMFDLLLETRRPEQTFLPYKPGGEEPATTDTLSFKGFGLLRRFQTTPLYINMQYCSEIGEVEVSLFILQNNILFCILYNIIIYV